MSGRLGRLPGNGKLRCEKRGRDSKPIYILDYRLSDGSRQRIALGTDKRMAETRQRQLLHERDLASMGLGGPVGMECQLRELKAMYLDDLKVRACERHVVNVSSTLDRVLDALRAKRVRELVPYDLMQHRAAQLSAGLATRTVNLQVACVRAMLTWALKAGLIEKNPLANLSPLRETEATKRYRRRALSEDEIEAFLSAAREDDRKIAEDGSLRGRPRVQQYPLWRSLLETGARYGELTQVAWSDVDLDQRVMYLRPGHTKAGRSRQIPIMVALAEELRRLRTKHASVLGRPLRADDRVYLTPRGCAWCRPTNNIMRAFDRILEDAGIDRMDAQGRKLDVHALRHTLATRLARSGAPLVQAQQILGHSDPKLTARVYSHLNVEDLRGAVESIGPAAETSCSRARPA